MHDFLTNLGPIIGAATGLLAAIGGGLRFVWKTNRLILAPDDIYETVVPHFPIIVAMWHGQHLMLPYARASNMGEVNAMVSRHRDAGLQAIALRRLGIAPVRGSGARGSKVAEKGGAKALIALKKQLERGATVAMTADVPKVARIAGLGIVTLGRISGRPIVPVAVVTSRRIDFKSWDRASIGLPG